MDGQHMMPGMPGKMPKMPMMDKAMARKPKRGAGRSKKRDVTRKPTSRGYGR